MTTAKELFHLLWPVVALFVLYYILIGAPGFFMAIILLISGVILSMFIPTISDKIKLFAKMAYFKIRNLIGR